MNDHIAQANLKYSKEELYKIYLKLDKEYKKISSELDKLISNNSNLENEILWQMKRDYFEKIQNRRQMFYEYYKYNTNEERLKYLFDFLNKN